MATCETCLHHLACLINSEYVPLPCPAYKDKADVVEVKHGYWKRNERNIPKMKEFHEKGIALSMSEKSIFYTCSKCGMWGSLANKYCSECGTKMDGTPKERGGEK